LIPGDTVYIRTKNAYFYFNEYTLLKMIYEEHVTLNSSDTWNESKDITAIWNATTGRHNITVLMDPENEISEINETNNNFSLPLSVNPSIDVEIVDISMHPELPKDGDCVNITAYVRNNGVKNANISVDLWMILKRDNISSPPPYDWQKEVGKKSIQVGEEIVNVSRVMYINF